MIIKQISDNLIEGEDWVLGWLGAITSKRNVATPFPLIEGVFFSKSKLKTSPDNLNLDQLTATGFAKKISVPFSMLSQLEIGSIWNRGEKIGNIVLERLVLENVHMSRSTSSIIKAGIPDKDSGNYLIPVAHYNLHIGNTHSYCVKVLHNGVNLIFPCAEIIRFYFGSSGSLLKQLVSPPFVSDLLWKKIDGENSRHPFIHLAQGISGRSASDIARVALSRSARFAAELIGSSCAAARVRNEPVYPKAIFPFEGETDLTILGKWLPFGDNLHGTFLVCKILTCSYPFPFSSLRYKTDFSHIAFEEEQALVAKNNKESVDVSSVLIVSSPAHKSKAPREILFNELENRFSDLTRKRVSKSSEQNADMTLLTRASSASPIAYSTEHSEYDPAIHPIELIQQTNAVSDLLEISSFTVFQAIMKAVQQEPSFSKVGAMQTNCISETDLAVTEILNAKSKVKNLCSIRVNNLPEDQVIFTGTATHNRGRLYILVKEENDINLGFSKCDVFVVHDKVAAITATTILTSIVERLLATADVDQQFAAQQLRVGFYKDAIDFQCLIEGDIRFKNIVTDIKLFVETSIPEATELSDSDEDFFIG